MQLHVNHTDPAEAAATLTYVQINAAIREVTQQLYGVLKHWGIPASPLACGTAPYTTAGNVANHPQLAWDAACQAHVDWVRAHAGALLLRWADYKGVDRTDHDAVAEVHGSAKHLRQIFATLDAHGAAVIPQGAITPAAWLASLTDAQRKRWAPRVATLNPPAGCLFGFLNMETPFWVENDCVGSYLKLHEFNCTRASILRLNPELQHMLGYGPAPPTAKQRAAIKAARPKPVTPRKRKFAALLGPSA